MGDEILASFQSLLPETGIAILPLLAEKSIERAERALWEKERGNPGDVQEIYRFMSIGNGMLLSLTRIAFDDKNYDLAEQAALRREDYFWAARAAKKSGRIDDARKYFSAYVERGDMNGFIIPSFFREVKEYFSGDEVEPLLSPLTERFGGNIPLLMRVFIAQEKGDKDFCRRVYRNSQRRLTRWQNKEVPDYEDDFDAVAEHYLWERELESDHANLCDVLGKHDKVLQFHLRDGMNAHLLLYPPFSDIVEKRDDKHEVYRRILSHQCLVRPARLGLIAMVHEKLGDEERARAYYHEALFREERDFDFAEALKIAKRLHLQERAIAYREIPAYLYEHGHI